MSAVLHMPGISAWRVALRSAAVNIPLGLVAIATVGGIYGIITIRSPDVKRREFLTSLGTNKVVPTELLMTFMDTKNVEILARQTLADKDLPEDLALALRQALILLL
jgi:hypothetical protein